MRLIRSFVAGKIQNTRHGVMRSAREAEEPAADALRQTAATLAESLQRLAQVTDPDEGRGVEGNAARAYFETFGLMVRANREAFAMSGRSRRPPRDRMNALLSFLYTLLTADCVAAVEGVGLDPQAGFLHAVRPGRPSLALDLVEEFRPVLVDRLALTLVNLRQVGPDDFEERAGGAVYLSDEGRRTVLRAYQQRKQEEVLHPLLNNRMPIGLVPHMQARILARYLRGELEDYVPFLYR